MNISSTYREYRTMTARSLIRHVVLDVLSRSRTMSRGVSNELPRIQFLCLHHLFPDEHDNFRRLLENLSQYYEVISYSEAVERIRGNTIEKPYLAISFDDGFRHSVDASEILKEYGLSAMFFICSDIYNELKGEKKNLFCVNKLLVPPLEFMSQEHINQILSNGMEVGFHTSDHTNMSKPWSKSKADENHRGLEKMRSDFGNIHHFAWPFGLFRDVNKENLKIVRSWQVTSIASAERGCHFPNGTSDSVILRRDPIIAAWPIRHVEYFLSRNATRMPQVKQ